jgi:hypothetical protein
MATPRTEQAAMQLKRAHYAEELIKLRQIFLKAEQTIVAEISRKQGREFVTYGEHAALERVQNTLRGMLDASWEYVPAAIEKQYLYGKYKDLRIPAIGYANAGALTATDLSVIERLTQNLMGELTQAAATAQSTIQSNWQEAVKLARLESDVFRTAALESLTASEATGMGARHARDIFIEKMRESGIAAFTDRSGRRWSLEAYSTMATRTTARQATNLAVLTADPEQDLYRISTHGTTCPVCAPLEGRVYSRSGTHPVYPPLALAFGKIDPAGPATLENSYLNIHPNCYHVLTPWSEEGRREEDVEKMRRFSSFEENPPTTDPRSKAQIEAYRAKEQGRAKLLGDIRQYERYRLTLGDKVPKTFGTFQKHKLAGSEKFAAWESAYRAARRG